ncbi:MAG: hypothetical protein ACXAB7_13310 [Candidatus Kariarchaeaceae archaeon]
MREGPNKFTSKLHAMAMQEFRVLIEEELTKLGYSSFLTNLTDNDLALKVIRNQGLPTIVSVTRNRNKPLEVEVTVDFSLLDSFDLIQKRPKAKTSRPGGSYFFYRWIWIGLILFWVIAAVFRFIIDGIVAVVEFVTPGWSDSQRSIGILSVATLIMFWWFKGRPMMQKIENQRRYKEDQILIQKVFDFIERLSNSVADHSLIKCWSCFNEIVRTENFCEHCGKAQN